MKTPKMTDYEKMIGALFCLIIPFLLFWSGLFVAAFFDSILTHLISLIPFYLYIFLFVNLSRKKAIRNGLMGSTYLALISLIILVALLILDFMPNYEYFLFLGRAAAANAPVVFAFALFGTFFETLDFRIRDIIENSDEY